MSTITEPTILCDSIAFRPLSLSVSLSSLVLALSFSVHFIFVLSLSIPYEFTTEKARGELYFCVRHDNKFTETYLLPKFIIRKRMWCVCDAMCKFSGDALLSLMNTTLGPHRKRYKRSYGSEASSAIMLRFISWAVLGTLSCCCLIDSTISSYRVPYVCRVFTANIQYAFECELPYMYFPHIISYHPSPFSLSLSLFLSLPLSSLPPFLWFVCYT